MTHQVLSIPVYSYTMKQYQPSIQRPIQSPPVHHSIYLMRLLYRHFHPSRHTSVTIPRLLPLHPTIYPIVPHFDDHILLPSKVLIDCRGITFRSLSERGANMRLFCLCTLVLIAFPVAFETMQYDLYGDHDGC